MSEDTPFYMTAMGRRFFEGTMPALVRELGRLADAVEWLATIDAAPAPGDAGQVPPMPPEAPPPTPGQDGAP